MVVDVPPELALTRLVDARGMAREDAEARIAAQIDRPTRLEGADLVVDNSGDRDPLAAEVDRVWAALLVLKAQADADAPSGAGSGSGA